MMVATWYRIRQSDVEMIAGSLSYTTMLSLVPLLAVSLSVFQIFGGLEHLLRQVEPFILKNLAQSSGVELSRYLSGAIRRTHSSTLGIGGIVGVLIASTKLFTDMERAIHRVWLLKKRRSLWKKVIVYWSIMFLAPLILAAALGVLGSREIGLIRKFTGPGLISVFALLALCGIYKWVPSRKVSWSPVLISAVIATGGLALAQEFYAELVKVLFRFSKVYGSLAGIPLFLMWVFVVWWIVLMGATLTALLQERRDRLSNQH